MNYSATAKAAELISQSSAQDKIAHASYSDELAHILTTECEDYCEAGDRVEFWGADDDGAEWRVHLDHEES